MPTALAHRGPNTVRLAKRFFWKECRRMAVLTAGVSVLAMGLMLLVRWFTPRSVDPADPLSVIAVGAGMMLAVAAAVTLFSVEKEEGTADLLERLPRNAAAMVIGKLGSAFVIVPLCTLALLIVAFAIGGDIADAQQIPRVMAPRVSLFLLEAFVWSLVASLTCANPLIAAVLGMVLASVSVQLGIFINNPDFRGFTTEDFNAASPTRLALAGIGVLLSGWLVTRWPAPPRKAQAALSVSQDRPLRRRLGVPWSRLGLSGRLLWQTLRQSLVTGVIATLLGLFLTFMTSLIPQGFFDVYPAWQFLTALGLLFAPAMLGAVIFRADQRRDAYRFLAEHAGRPRMLWLVRNTVGLAMLAVLMLLLVVAWIGFLWVHARSGWVHLGWPDDESLNLQVLRITQGLTIAWHVIFVVVAAVLSAYAWGQFFSLALKSDVIAAMMALIASVGICASVVVIYTWRLPPLMFMLPLAIGALLASLLRVRDWMFDRRGVWRWAAPIAALVAPLVWLAWAVPAERLAQVAVNSPAIRTGDFTFASLDVFVNQTREELRLGKEVAEAYVRLEGEEVTYDDVEGESDEYGFPETIIRPVHGRLDGKALEEFLRLSRIKCRLALSRFGTPSVGSGLQAIALMDSPDAKEPIDLDGRLERLLACRRVGIQQSNFGSLRDAMYPGYLADEFIAWATEEGQTSERIKKAIVGLREAEAMMVGPIGRLMNEYVEAKAVFSGERGSLLSLSKQEEPRPEVWLALFAHEAFAFERERALKALDLLTAYEAAYLGEAMAALTSSRRTNDWLDQSNVDDARLIAGLSDTTPSRGATFYSDLKALANVRTSNLLSESLRFRRVQMPLALRNWIAGVARRRAERVGLALIAYRLDHDEYPESLEALVGVFLESEEIRDPYSKEIFGWAPKGFEFPFMKNEYQTDLASVAPGTPLLWSVSYGSNPVQSEAEIGEDGEFVYPPAYGGFGGGGFGGEVFDEEDSDDQEDDATLVPIMRMEGRESFWLPLPK